MSTTVAPPSAAARPAPKQARSRATRRRILEAAVACLVERGYAGASTTEIGRRAGVSQGALFKHFSSKLDLLGAAVAHLFAQMVHDYERAFSELAGQSPGDRLDGAIRLLRRTFAEPRLQAAFELYVAARTDAALSRTIAPVLRAHRDNLREVARSLFPTEAARTHDFDAFVDIVLDAMQGAALGAVVLPDPTREQMALEALERWARTRLGVEETC